MNQKTASCLQQKTKWESCRSADSCIQYVALPMMVSMLVQAFYNIVDSIFVAKLSENALTAVPLAFRYRCCSSQLQPVPALV